MRKYLFLGIVLVAVIIILCFLSLGTKQDIRRFGLWQKEAYACPDDYRACPNGFPMPRDPDCTWREDKCPTGDFKPIDRSIREQEKKKQLEEILIQRPK